MPSKSRSRVANWMPLPNNNNNDNNGTQRLKRQKGQRFSGSLVTYNNGVKKRRDLRLKMEKLISQFNEEYKEPYEYYLHKISKPLLALDYKDKYTKKLNKLRDKFMDIKEWDEIKEFEREYTETFETSKMSRFPWREFSMKPSSYKGGNGRTRKVRR